MMLAPNTALMEGTRKLLTPRPQSLATLKYSLGTYLLETFPFKFFFENPTHAPRVASSEKGYQIIA